MVHSLSTNVQSTEAIVEALMTADGVSRSHQSVETGIRKHPETFHLQPDRYSNAESAELFSKAAAEEKQREMQSRTFQFRPWDVSLALSRVCRNIFGHEPMSNPHTSRRQVPVSIDDEVSVIWGQSEIPELKAVITYDSDMDPKLGMLGTLYIETPKKLHPAVRSLFAMVDEDLRKNSIYKGKAITSDSTPKFLDPYATNRNEIVWSRSVDAALRGSLINVIRHMQRARDRGIKRHRSVLFYGEPGNGKSETINIVAQECVENDVTYVLATTSLREALQSARLLAPAVIAAEDFERLVNQATEAERNELLEELDGTTAKGKEIMLVTTTNFIEDLYQAARRRMFKEIYFGPLDVEGIERFLELKLKAQAAPGLDYAAVAKQLEGWGNSYIAKVIDFAASLALEHETPSLTTQDLLDSVEAQRPDWEGYLQSKARPEVNKFDQVFKELVVTAATDALAIDFNGSEMPLVRSSNE